MNNLTKEQKFAIYWCFNRAMERVEQTLVTDDRDLIVDGININQTIRDLLKDRLFV
jgi:hypothetical protein